jgi:hypothetical protein
MRLAIRLGIVGLLAVFAACQQGHPISVKIDKGFTNPKAGTAPIEKIAVMPFLSALNDADDPDGDAPRTMEKFFTPALNERADYKFVSSGTIQYAVDVKGWQEDYARFRREYPRTDKPDMDFLTRLADELKVDAFLIPVVDTWYKDEVDVTESASATTTVGATLTIIDVAVEPGRILFRAVDEDYQESARAETGDRSLVTSSSGIIRADTGARLYAAPPYEDVAPKVVEALVGSLPPR